MSEEPPPPAPSPPPPAVTDRLPPAPPLALPQRARAARARRRRRRRQPLRRARCARRVDGADGADGAGGATGGGGGGGGRGLWLRPPPGAAALPPRALLCGPGWPGPGSGWETTFPRGSVPTSSRGSLGGLLVREQLECDVEIMEMFALPLGTPF